MDDSFRDGRETGETMAGYGAQAEAALLPRYREDVAAADAIRRMWTRTAQVAICVAWRGA
jgi:hypothetical protein